MMLRRHGHLFVYEIPGLTVIDRIMFRLPLTDRAVGLSPKQRDVMIALMACYPNPVLYDRLIEYVYPDPDKSPQNEINTIRVFVEGLRKKLAEWPFAIELRHQLGYQLIGEKDAEDRSRRRAARDEVPGSERGLRGVG